MIQRHATVVDEIPHLVQWNIHENYGRRPRNAAIVRLARKRRRFIWHKIPRFRQRVLFPPAGFNA